MPSTLAIRYDRARMQQKADLVEEAVRLAPVAAEGDDAFAGTIEAFVRHYYANVSPDDVIGRAPADLFGAAASHLRLAERRPAGTALVRVHNPTSEDGWQSSHTVVEVVTDDMPFLVDSVSAELTRHDYGIHLVIHPQLRVRRDAVGGLLGLGDRAQGADAAGAIAESFIHVEIDRQVNRADMDRLRTALRSVLEDVRAVVEDWSRMCGHARSVVESLRRDPPPLPAEEIGEAAELLDWMVGQNFTFLGYREYRLVEDGRALASVPGTGLGILRDAGLAPVQRSFADLPPEIRAKAMEHRLLTLTKANSRATVHRPAYLDYIGVKQFGPDGEVVGERRFLGLFSSTAYNVSVQSVPVVRRKVEQVVARAGFEPNSHDANDLVQILETYPRDELFQISVDDLFDICLGILRLQERRRVQLFVRRDDYGRFISCLLFLPRERYTTRVRLRVQDILMAAFHGTGIDYTARLSESVLARLHFVVRTDPGDQPEVDLDALHDRLAAATRSWVDDLHDAVVDSCGEADAAALLRRYGEAFPEAYKEDFPARTAVTDIRRLEGLRDERDLSMLLYRPAAAGPGERRFKILRIGPPLSLSEVMPMLQDMGVEVIDERPYGLVRRGGDPAWIYDFGLRHDGDDELEADGVREAFQEAFAAVWTGRMESDGFNALVLDAGLTAREVVVLRAYCKYLRQVGTKFSQSYIEQTLAHNVAISRLLVDLFEARFDPTRADAAERETAEITAEIEAALDDVASLDEDRILRSYLQLMLATLRTNHFQRDAGGEPRPYLSLKLDPGRVPDLPRPLPKFEIFVYSPRTEGVHLRFGAVARGGLRWSDRREDFRTEVLGLVKAQMVKNAVIVPVGAKGGFVVKRPPQDADRDALQAEVVSCYSTFIRGLLDITDNLVDGSVVPPEGVVRHDADDSYLVVAADKGTATFSDIANDIAAEYGYWLGDAFASGGSSGYDHKGMGITARGAWESVKRHFRELGVDVQKEDFTAVGIGDMSGDVFGNGMLLSRHIRLVAAFDHRHVFLDPDPDPATSYAERERLFRLPRSTWDDYDRSLISAGGGVYPRTAKSIRLSPQVRAALEVEAEALTPAELIRRILLAPVDLLWNGGIGTYVKAATETHADVGDKSNESVRVDGRDLRCRVVGEGGNLGFTQRGRIEFALAGGHINTDAIDNSAGVDTSDHEVNIKILLNRRIAAGELTLPQRDELLAEMTDEVAGLVLRDNYEQTVALGNARAQAASLLHVHARFISRLEADGKLDRELEALPSEQVVAERRAAGLGLTGPEFAVLLAYVKITETEAILDSDLPEDPYLRHELERYFPAPLRDRFREAMQSHPLRREIIATSVVNQFVNHGGMTLAYRIGEETAATVPDIVRAHTVAREIFGMPRLWTDIEALDNQVDTATQTGMLLEARRLAERATRWLLNNRRPPLDIAATIVDFTDGIAAVLGRLAKLLPESERAELEERTDQLRAGGVPGELARLVAGFGPAFSALDIVEVSSTTGRPVEEVAEVYFVLDDRLHFGQLRDRINALPRDDRWHTLARAALRDDLFAAHAALTSDIVTRTDASLEPDARIGRWVQANQAAVGRAGQMLADIAAVEVHDLATLSVALRHIRGVIASSAQGG